MLPVLEVVMRIERIENDRYIRCANKRSETRGDVFRYPTLDFGRALEPKNLHKRITRFRFSILEEKRPHVFNRKIVGRRLDNRGEFRV
jgi:hypothetical protein